MMAGLGNNKCNKVIALIDMDCFYVQVEERDDPSIKGIPAAVVQYKTWKGGGIIAVNYEARARGVTRSMRGDDAKAACPEIVLVRVPESNEKADLTKYRDAGKEVVDVLCEFSSHVERASIDEAYIDLTEAVNNFITIQGSGDALESLKLIDKTNLENSFPFGYENSECWLKSILSSEILQIDDVKLALGAEIVGKMRRAVYEKTGFRCSAGIAHNKILAKLGAGFNKPNKQTVISHESVPSLYQQIKVKKVRNLGGQFGDVLVEKLGCEKMSDLLKFTLKQLQLSFGDERGEWLYNLARGYDNEPVTPRQLPQTIGCSKNFMGREALDTKEKANFWISRLCIEVVERIQRDWEMNNRRAKLLTLHVTFKGQKGISRSCGKNNVPYNPDKMASSVMLTMEKVYQQFGVRPINNLGLIASKLEEESIQNTKIDFFYHFKTPKLNNNDLPSSASTSSVQSDTSEKKDFGEKNGKTNNSKSNGGNSDNVKNDITCVVLPISSNILLDLENNDVKNINKMLEQDYEEKDGNNDQVQQIEILRAESIRNEGESTPVKSNNIFKDEGISAEKRKPLFTCSLSPPKIKKFALPQQTLFEMKNITVNGKTLTSQNQNHGISTITNTSTIKTTPIKNSNNTKYIDNKTSSNSIDDQVPCCSKSLNLNTDSTTAVIVDDDDKTSKSKGEVEMTFRNENSESCPLFLCNDDDDSSTSGTKTLAKEYVQHCPRCNTDIPLWDYLSHTDFHVAMDLQNEFNTKNNSLGVTNSKINTNSESVVVKEPTEKQSSNNNNINVGSKRPAAQNGRGKGGAKRGRSTSSATTNTTTTSTPAHRQPQMKTLHSYFQPKI